MPLRRFCLLLALILGASALSTGPAFAALAATASVDRHTQFRGDTDTFTFTVNNTSTAGETIGSVQIAVPSAEWAITACPAAPAGWTAVQTATDCTFNSAAGAADNIPAGGSATFQVTATAVPGSTDATGSWTVVADQDDTFDGGANSAAATGAGGDLATTIFVWEILDAFVAGAAVAEDSPCPASPNHTAPAGSTRTIVICGVNHADIALTPDAANSTLGGSFVQTAGSFASGPVVPTPAGQNVVLANYTGTVITSDVGTNKTVVARIGSAPNQLSPTSTISPFTAADATAPAAPTFTGTSPQSPANHNTIAVRGIAEAGSTVSLYSDAACTRFVISGSAANFASPGFTVTVPDNSTTTFYATATDAAGNTSACSTASITYVEDSAAPAAPVITAAPRPNPGNENRVQWAFTGEPGSTFECVLTAPDGNVVITPRCTSPANYVLVGDGTYTFMVRQTDAAGNVSSYSSSSYTLDTAAPTRPTLTSVPEPDPGSNPSVQWAFTGTEPGGRFECVLTPPGAPAQSGATPGPQPSPGAAPAEVTITNCTSPQSFLLTEGDGTYTFKVRQIDAAGNASPFAIDTYTLDREAPGAGGIPVALLPLPPLPSHPYPRVQLVFGAVPEELLKQSLAQPVGAIVTTGATGDTGAGDATALTGASTGSAGEAARSTRFEAPGGAGVQAAQVTPVPAPTIGQGFVADRFECAMVPPLVPARLSSLPNAQARIEIDTDCVSPKAYTLNDGDGVYTFAVRGIDAAGNVSPSSRIRYRLGTAGRGSPFAGIGATPGASPAPGAGTDGTAGTAGIAGAEGTGATTGEEFVGFSETGTDPFAGLPDSAVFGLAEDPTSPAARRDRSGLAAAELPFTGAPVLPWGLTALALMLGGLILVLLGRSPATSAGNQRSMLHNAPPPPPPPVRPRRVPPPPPPL